MLPPASFRKLIAASSVSLLILTAYFSIGAIATPIGSASVSILHYDENGAIVISTSNVFSSGENIWLQMPSSSTSPFWLNIYKLATGRLIFNHTGSISSMERGLHLGLSPSLFPASSSYHLGLTVAVQSTPGIIRLQQYSADIIIVPGRGQLSVEALSRTNGQVGANLTLSDYNHNPMTGVRLRLTLHQGNSSTPLVSDVTGPDGKAFLGYGESISAGRYTVEASVIDTESVRTKSITVGNFTVEAKQTSLSLRSIGTVQTQATLLDASSSNPVSGRLLTQEQQIADGNWTIIGQAYTGNNGQAIFTIPPGHSRWRLAFKGDTFYGPSAADSTELFLKQSAFSTLLDSTSYSPSSTVLSGIKPLSPLQPLQPVPDSCLCPCPNRPTSVSLSLIVPDCGGGGGGGGSYSTTTTLYLPLSVYATITAVLVAQVSFIDQGTAYPLLGVSVSFYRGAILLGSAVTNSTGHASFAWTPGTTDSYYPIYAYYFGSTIGGATFTPSQDYKFLTINQTPTIIMILNPLPIAYSWDLQYRYSDGRPIVATIVTLELAANGAGNGSPANIHMPAYNGTSSAPVNYPGYSWRGLNNTSVTLTFNGSYTQIRAMNWTRNFYLPACISQPCSISLTPRSGRFFLSTQLSPPNSLYAPSSTNLSIPYQLVTSSPSAADHPIGIDGAVNRYCGSGAGSCTVTLSTSNSNDLIIVYVSTTLPSNSAPCTFALSDTNNLVWKQRARIRQAGLGLDSKAVDIAEYYANATATLSSDVITFTACQPPYAWYSGLMAFGVKNYNTIRPFDANPLALSTSGSRTPPAATYVTTSNPTDMIVAGVVTGYAPSPHAGAGYTMITTNSSYAQTAEYRIVSNVVSNLNVNMSATVSQYSPFAMIADSIQAYSPLIQDASPPNHIYVNVNATYPYLSVKLEGFSVALAAYNAQLAYSLGPPPSSLVSGGYTYFALPSHSDFAYVCTGSQCQTPAANVTLYLYAYVSSTLTYCGYAVTNNRGVASLTGTGPYCGYPYAYAAILTSTSSPAVSELFHIEAYSSPAPFYTNFDGYNFVTYPPQRTGRYLLHMFTWYLNPVYTFLYPGTAPLPDVKYPYNTCCDIFLNVERHPINVNMTVTPEFATILSTINASLALQDLATGKPLASSSFSYVLSRVDPNPQTIATGTLTTSVNGTSTLSIGSLPYGNYTITLTRTGNYSIADLSYVYRFTVYKALPTLVASSGWITNAVANQPVTLRTSLVNKATQTLIALAGLNEYVYVNNVLFGSYSTNSGGNVTFTWTPSAAGQYEIDVRLNAQSYYAPSSVTIMASVTRRVATLTFVTSPSDPEKGSQTSWNVTAYDMYNNHTIAGLSIIQYVDGNSVLTLSTSSNGNAAFTYTFTSVGTHNVTFLAPQSAAYNAVASYNPVVVYSQTSLSFQTGTITIGQQNSIGVTLKDATGQSLSGRVVTIEINGVFYQNVTTGNAGQAQFVWRPDKVGNYSITAKFWPPTSTLDRGYRSSSSSIVATVVPAKVTNTDVSQDLSLVTASGAAVAVPANASPTITVSGDTVNISFGGVSGSLKQWNQFGWNCVAYFFGSCVMKVPTWTLHFDIRIQSLYIGILYNVLSLDSPGLTVSMPGLSQTIQSYINSPAFWAGAGATSVIEGVFLIPLLAGIFIPGVGEAASLVFLVGFPLAVAIMNAWASVTYQQKSDRQKFAAGVLANIVSIRGVDAVESVFAKLAGTASEVPGLRDIIFRGLMMAAMIAAVFFLANS